MCRSDTHSTCAGQRAELVSGSDPVRGSASPAARDRRGLNLALGGETLALVDHLVAVLGLGAVGAGQLHLLLSDFFLAATFTLVIDHVCLC